MTRRNVSIVQRRLTHYRVPLFERLRTELRRTGISLRVLHGEPTAAERTKKDGGTLPWAERLPTHYFANGAICWQPFAARCRGSDLVVVTQENKLINNLGPLLNVGRPPRLAFWGHGANLQATDDQSWAERFKRWTTCRVDWWFAYTDISAALVQRCGFDPERITVLNNSIDTSALRADVAAAGLLRRDELRRSLGLQADGPVAVFVGSLYADKRIDWLVAAAAALRARIPGAQLAIAGAGPLEPMVRAAASQDAGIVYVGAVSGPRKAKLLACADVMLNPGLVGLGILDAFATGLPLLTTTSRRHGPEIAYLHHGVNGLMVDDDLDAFIAASQTLMLDAALRERLGTHAAASCAQFTLEGMVDRFANGIRAALVP